MPGKNKNKQFHIDVNLAQKNYVINLLYDMFPLTDKTFVGVMIDNKHRTFSVKYIVDHIDSFVGKKSVYFTGNIVKPMKNRCQKNISVLNDVYLDLDTNHCNNSCFASPLSAYWQVQDFIEERNIPKPSLVINTTRGLQLHWFIDPISVTEKRIGLWEKIEKSLSEQFSFFYSDRTVATDYARLLRFPYSVNAKTNDFAEILDYDGERYSIGDLAKCVLTIHNNEKVITQHDNNGIATAKQLKYVNDICNILHLDNPNINTYSEANSFIRKYKDQIKGKYANCFKKDHLMACPRKGEKYNVELEKRNAMALERYVEDHRQNQHCRETLLFLYRLMQLHITGDETLAWEKVCTLNKMYDDPFLESKLNTLTFSAVRYFRTGDSRWYGPNAIEMKVVGDNNCDSILPYFYHDKKKFDHKVYNKAYYENKLSENNLEKKSVQIQRRREEVRDLRSRGLSYKEIAKKLNVSTKTIQRDLLCMENSAQKVDKNSNDNLLNIYTSGISPLVDCSSLSGQEVLDEEDIEDIVIFNELKKANQHRLNNKNEIQDNVKIKDVVDAFDNLTSFINKECSSNKKVALKYPIDYTNMITTLDEMLFLYENIDILQYKKDAYHNEYIKEVGIFGKVIVYLSREAKPFIRKVFCFISNVLKTENDMENIKNNLYEYILNCKKLDNIESYYVKKRERSQLQIQNSYRTYKSRNMLKMISAMKPIAKDYYVEEAIDRFFYWYNHLRNADKNEAFVVNGVKWNKNEFAKEMFYRASFQKIENASKKIKTGSKINEVLLCFINN